MTEKPFLRGSARRGGPAHEADTTAILALKARYVELLDGKRWTEFGKLFTEDAYLETTRLETTHLRIEGRAAIVESVSRELQHAITVHRVHTPVITFTGAATAHGVWSMTDDLDYPAPDGGRMRVGGAGEYHEEYRKAAGRWRISGERLVREKVDRTTRPSGAA